MRGEKKIFVFVIKRYEMNLGSSTSGDCGFVTTERALYKEGISIIPEVMQKKLF